MSQAKTLSNGVETTDRSRVNSEISTGTWQLMGAAALANRLVLGWIYWGGASRRFIYAT